MIADPVDIAHLSAHCQPAPEKLEADVCAEADDGERRCRRDLQGASGSDDRLARYAA
jgi:hypothetical protein